MTIIIIHYHLRPGGIRRIIELATPHLVRQLDVKDVVLATGERANPNWVQAFRRQMPGTRVEVHVEPAFSYLSEQAQAPRQIERQIRGGLEKLLAGATPDNTLIWAHNLGVGRNLLLTRAVTRAGAARRLKVLLHHHDWWFDNRWRRWPEMRRSGFRTLRAAAEAIFPVAPSVRHVAINRSDAAPLQRWLLKFAGWLPNLTEHGTPPPAGRVRAARAWLSSAEGGVRSAESGQSPEREVLPNRYDRQKDGDRRASTIPRTTGDLEVAAAEDGRTPGLGQNAHLSAPVWILPCRLLRRKNVAEALLLTRWLRPEACLVTTGGVSSADEKGYFDQIDRAARRHGWPLRLGILQGDETHRRASHAGLHGCVVPQKPSVAELLAASEVVLLTSIQEGFGLPYLEAAAAGRPLIARSLPNIAPDLEHFGFRFPQNYDEIRIDPSLFNWAAEQRRQVKCFRAWRQRLPRAAQSLVGQPIALAGGGRPRPVPFSRLTLTAQLEVLAQPPGDSWARCAPLNPFLSGWRTRAAAGRLRVTPWPRAADRWLSGLAYARRFADIAFRSLKGPVSRGAVLAVQPDFLREKLRAEHLFPLLWDM